MVNAVMEQGTQGMRVHVSMLAVDTMVTEYMESQANPKSGDPPNPRVSLALARDMIASGDMSSALNVINSKLPQLMQDQRLVFRLYKQQFVELMRSGQAPKDTVSGLTHALGCARSQLAPAALDAYPEAYTEFKHAMQLLLYADNQGVGSSDWPTACTAMMDPSTRLELSEVLYQTAMQQLGLTEPRLVQLLAYLLRLRRQYGHLITPTSPNGNQQPENGSMHPASPQQGNGHNNGGGMPGAAGAEATSSGLGDSSVASQAASPRLMLGKRRPDTVSELCDRLLRPRVDAAGLPPVTYGPTVTSFNESDIQALTRTVSQERRDAIASLRTCNNQLQAAFKQELNRTQLNRPFLDALVGEYCDVRGLPLPGQGVGSQQDKGCWVPVEEVAAAVIDCVHLDDRGMDVAQAERQGGQGIQGDGAEVAEEGMHVVVMGQDNMNLTTLRSNRRQQDSHDGSSHIARVSKQRSASQSPPAKLPCCRPEEHAGAMFAQEDHVMDAEDQLSEQGQGTPPQLSQLPDIAKVGGPQALHYAVIQMDPDFWDQQPTLLFELLRVQFSCMVAVGDIPGALVLARTRMTPLVIQNTALQPQLKAVMALLIPGASTTTPATTTIAMSNGLNGPSKERPATSSLVCVPTLDEVCTSVMQVLSNTSAAAGSQTRLVLLIKELLALHRVWQRSEKSSDPFQSLVGITELRLTGPQRAGLGPTSSLGPTTTSDAHGGQSHGMMGEGQSDGADVDTRNGGVGYHSYGASRAASMVRGVGILPPLPGVGRGGAIRQAQMGMQALIYDESDEDEDGHGYPGGGNPGEGDVSRLMEILNLSRAQALALLMEFGDVENAVNSAFG